MGKKKRKIKKLKQKIKQLEAQLEIQQQKLSAYISKEIPQPNDSPGQNRDREASPHDSAQPLDNYLKALSLDNQCSGKFGDRSND